MEDNKYIVIGLMIFAPIIILIIITAIDGIRVFKKKKASLTARAFIPQMPNGITNDYSDCTIFKPRYTCPDCGAIIREGEDACSSCGHKRPESMVKLCKVFSFDGSVLSGNKATERNSCASYIVNSWFAEHNNLSKVNVNIDYKKNRGIGPSIRYVNSVTVTFKVSKDENSFAYGIAPLYYGTGSMGKELMLKNALSIWNQNNTDCIVENTTGGKTTYYQNNVESGSVGTAFITYRINR